MGTAADQGQAFRDDLPESLPEGLGDAIRTTAEEIAELLRGAPDTGAPVPGLTWTVGRWPRTWRRPTR